MEALDGVTDKERTDWFTDADPSSVLIVVSTNAINSSLTIPGLTTGWTFGWQAATQYACVQGWRQIAILKQTPADQQQVIGRLCKCHAGDFLGRPLGYLIFSLRALIRDPIY